MCMSKRDSALDLHFTQFREQAKAVLPYTVLTGAQEVRLADDQYN